MKGELTAIIEKAPEGGYWAICPEIPSADGQGGTVQEAKEILDEARLNLFWEIVSKISKGVSLKM